MKKTIVLLSALMFSLALMIPSLVLADDMKHMEEGSGGKMDKSSKEYKDKMMHSKEYKDGKGHMEEGSAKKEEYEKKADHEKMEEGSKEAEKMKMKMKARQREGS